MADGQTFVAGPCCADDKSINWEKREEDEDDDDDPTLTHTDDGDEG